MKTPLLNLLSAAALGVAGAMAAADSALPTPERIENLTLEHAVDIAESLHPELAEARAMVHAAEGRARQAGTFPNPEAIAGAQQIPFGGGAQHEREYVAGIAQTLPLGPRLSKARAAELFDREVRLRGLEVKRRDIRKRVQSAFATALYQERASHAQAQIEQNARKAVATTRARVEAGDALREDLARVEMELARAQVEMRRAESLRGQSLVLLSAALGDAAIRVESLVGSLEVTFEIPTLETLAANLAVQPERAQADAEVRARIARVAAAEAERIPDVRVELLYHRLEASRQNTLDIGLSIPLPLFGRNEGRLIEARSDVAAAQARARMTRNELAASLRETHLQLTTALETSRMLKTEILSRADAVLSGAEARYAAGDISLAELLPVRRDWAEVQTSYLESLRDVMQAWAALSPYLERK